MESNISLNADKSFYAEYGENAPFPLNIDITPEKRKCKVHGNTTAFFSLTKSEDGSILGGPYCGSCYAEFLNKTIGTMEKE